MDNAFKTLGATPRDDRERLRELCDEKELLFDDASVYNEAYSDLINSKKRIIHEMTYFAGDVFNPYFALVSRKSSGRLATEKTAQTIVSAGRWFSEVRDDADDLIEEINESRELSGFPALEDDSVFSGDLDELKRQCVSSLTALLDRAGEESVVSLFNQIVEIDDFQCYFIDELMAYYELRMQETMDAKRKACDGKLDSLLTKCNLSWIRAMGGTDLQSDMDSLLNAVKKWDEMAQPLQVNMQKWGGQHEQSRDFIHEMRNRIVQTVNDAQEESNRKLESIVRNSVYGYMSDSSRNEGDNTLAALRTIIETMETLTSKLIEIFSELETVAAQLKGDLTALHKIKSQLPSAKKETHVSTASPQTRTVPQPVRQNSQTGTVADSQSNSHKASSGLYYGINSLIPALYLLFSILVFVACFLPLCANATGSAKGTSLCDNNGLIDSSDDWFCGYTVVNLIVAIPLSIYGFVKGGKSEGEEWTLYQIIAVVGMISMAIGIIISSCVCGEVSDTYITVSSGRNKTSRVFLDPGSGPVMAVVCSVLCFVLLGVLLFCTKRLSKNNPDYAETEQNLKNWL